MVFYVAHEYGGKPENMEKARKITHDLQVSDPDNTYICPILAFSHLKYGEMGYKQELEQCLDLLMLCDVLMITSDISEGVAEELRFARKVGMEVEFFEP